MASDAFYQWLGYFINRKHDYGIVHAWISALREWVLFSYRNCQKQLQSADDTSPLKYLSKLKYDLLSPIEFMGSSADEQVLASLGAPSLKRATARGSGNSTVIPPDSDKQPRRIWDICANRVIPTTWFPPDFPHAPEGGRLIVISHSWVAPDARKYILTNINCRTWPVPLPCDVQAEDIRRELLRCSTRFAWLDILCLRQESRRLQLSE